MSNVTQLLQAIGRGDRQASAELLPLVYEELRRLARAHMAQERAKFVNGILDKFLHREQTP